MTRARSKGRQAVQGPWRVMGQGAGRAAWAGGGALRRGLGGR